jgi:phosphoserine aminotransferase
MMLAKRVFNFSAGPAAIPEPVLKQAAAEMLDWHGEHLSVWEMSHRGSAFTFIIRQAEDDLRELLEVPSTHRILFMQGGATAMNAVVPMNLVNRPDCCRVIDFVHTGLWSGKALLEAPKYAQVHVAATSEDTQFTYLPPQDSWQLTEQAAYVHVCPNETVHGVQFHFQPDTGNIPLVADMSSEILSRPVDFSCYDVVYAGAQKNMGPAGLVVVIVREDLIGHAMTCCPSVFDWAHVAEAGSMFNTPPTGAIYLCGLILKWLKQRGGVSRMQRESIEKSQMLYDYIDSSNLYYNPVEKVCRSRMNVPFFLRDASLEDAFLAGAKQRGLVQLKGHRIMGGMRASLYNAMPIEGVDALVRFMSDFEGKRLF